MTDRPQTMADQARELLAAEYEAEGFPRIARSVRRGSSVLSSPVVCRAIEKALLTQKDRLDKLEGALRAIAEGNLGDHRWQADYLRIREFATNALAGSHT